MIMIVIVHSPEKNAKHHIWTRPVDWRHGLNTGSLIIHEMGIETTGRSDTNSQRFLNPKARVHERFPSEFTSQVEWSCLITLSLVFIRSNNIVPVCFWWCSTPNCVLPGPSSCVDSRLSWRRTVRNKVERVSALVTWWTSPKYGYTPETAIT